MDKRIYELMVFHQDALIYYTDFLGTGPRRPESYSELQESHRIQNCLGLSTSISMLVKQIHPDRSTEFRNFKTKEYQYNLHETLNGLKFILVTSVLPRTEDEEVEAKLLRIYQSYIDLVSRNYLYTPGSIIINERFEHSIFALFKKQGS